MNANLFARLAGGLPGRPRAGVPGDRGRRGAELRRPAGAGGADLLRCCAPRGSSPATGWRCRSRSRSRAVCLYLAVLQAGAVYVPLNTGLYRAAELAHFLADAEPKVAGLRSGRAWRAGAAGGGAGLDLHARGRGRGDACWRRRRGCRRSGRWRSAAGGDLAAILYTSGTTGRSKGAMLTGDNLWSNVATLHAAWGFRPDDVLIHALPLFHTHGLFVALNLMLLNGGRMIFLPRFEAEAVIGLLAAGDGADGGADLLYAAAGEPGADPRGGGGDAAFRVGVGAAAGGDACGVRGADRAADPRALRDDRDRDERVEPAGRRAAGGDGGAGAAGGRRCGSAAPTGRRSAGRGRGCWRCGGRTSSPATGGCRRRPPRRCGRAAGS